MLQSPHSLDDPLFDFAFDLMVSDDLKLLIHAGFLHPCEHARLLSEDYHIYKNRHLKEEIG